MVLHVCACCPPDGDVGSNARVLCADAAACWGSCRLLLLLCCHATLPGLLYQPGDYAQAAKLVQGLLADSQARARLAQAGRQEVELFGWSAATRVLREQQYARAVRLSVGKKRFWWLALRVRLACMVRLLVRVVGALWQAAVMRLDYARPYRASANMAT